MLDKVQKKLGEASSTIEGVARSRRQIDRRLARVESLPEREAALLLGIDRAAEAAAAEE
jgi:DNA recombination protein RmuC